MSKIIDWCIEALILAVLVAAMIGLIVFWLSLGESKGDATYCEAEEGYMGGQVVTCEGK